MGTAEYNRVRSCFLAISSLIKQFICTHQRANLKRPKSKFDKYGKLSSNLFKTKVLDFYAKNKLDLIFSIPWRKARRLAEFTSTYEVADNFVDRKSKV